MNEIQLPKVYKKGTVRTLSKPKIVEHQPVSISSVYPSQERLFLLKLAKGIRDYKILTKEPYSVNVNPSDKKGYIVEGGNIGEIFIHTCVTSNTRHSILDVPSLLFQTPYSKDTIDKNGTYSLMGSLVDYGVEVTGDSKSLNRPVDIAYDGKNFYVRRTEQYVQVSPSRIFILVFDEYNLDGGRSKSDKVIPLNNLVEDNDISEFRRLMFHVERERLQRELDINKKKNVNALLNGVNMKLPIDKISVTVESKEVILYPSLFPYCLDSTSLLIDEDLIVLSKESNRVPHVPKDQINNLSLMLLEELLSWLYQAKLPTALEISNIISKKDTKAINEIHSLVYITRYLGLAYYPDYFISMIPLDLRVGI